MPFVDPYVPDYYEPPPESTTATTPPAGSTIFGQPAPSSPITTTTAPTTTTTATPTPTSSHIAPPASFTTSAAPPSIQTPGVPTAPFVPPPRPAPVGSGGETPAAAANAAQPGLRQLGPAPSTIQPQDPRAVLASLYTSRGVDPNNPTGPLSSLGNVDYYINRLQDTGGWRGGNIDYWKNRLGQDIDLSQYGIGAQPEQNQALIGAGLGNQPGAYFTGAHGQDERAGRLRGKLLDLLRVPGQAQSAANQASRILEPGSEEAYAQSTEFAAPPTAPGFFGQAQGGRQQLQEAIRAALARGDQATAQRLSLLNNLRG